MTTDTCRHGELDAVCRACCDPLQADDAAIEWHRASRRRAGVVAALLILAALVALAWIGGTR